MTIPVLNFPVLHSFLEIRLFAIITLFCLRSHGVAQEPDIIWNPTHTPGIYRNPIIHADYSDPDAIRVGDDYYMTASSFSHFPGLPILHSKDLVHWTIIGHAVQEYPFPEFAAPQHGNGIWAPSLRYHKGRFYIYFGDPDHGVLMTTATDPAGPWAPLKLVKKVTGWIDCCPLWDDDGNAYLVHAFANSRSGINSILGVCRMNPEGTEVFSPTTIVFNGQKDYPTIEGPKFYKRNGYYYIFAPAGGVKPGWQTVLRSKDVFGPYEPMITLEQGSTLINGPHQGAWITTPSGEDWFIHFQDRYAYGRLVHLQPMTWENDWPVMGSDFDQNGIGEPVSAYHFPVPSGAVVVPQTSDEFNNQSLGLQWQWQSSYESEWYTCDADAGILKLHTQYVPSDENLWNFGHLLLQKIPASNCTFTVKINAEDLREQESAGLTVFGLSYSCLGVEKTADSYRIAVNTCDDADKGMQEHTMAFDKYSSSEIYLRVTIRQANPGVIIPEVLCQYSYSKNGRKFHPIGESIVVREGKWVGAKVGLFNRSPAKGSRGSISVDWFRVTEK